MVLIRPSLEYCRQRLATETGVWVKISSGLWMPFKKAGSASNKVLLIFNYAGFDHHFWAKHMAFAPVYRNSNTTMRSEGQHAGMCCLVL